MNRDDYVAMVEQKERDEVAMARRVSSALKPSRKWVSMVRVATMDDGAIVWSNEVYTATLRRYQYGWPFGSGPWAIIGIYCEDGEPRHDWRDFQRIKNDLVGPEWEAVELYPAESRLMDPSNYYSLWCFSGKIQIGKDVGRVFKSPANAIAPQRGWAKGDEPPELK
jgi:hypothetical protein